VQQTAEQADERFLLAVTSFFGGGKISQNWAHLQSNRLCLELL
jgi:hypothetical protein